MPLGIPASVPDSIAQRNLAEADLILREGALLFGRRIPVAEVPDWHAVVESEGHWATGPLVADRHSFRPASG